MSIENEFKTVDIIVNSNAPTKAVDAFSLSLIKVERQVRKLFTYIVFQYPCFSYADTKSLKEILADNRRVYFDGFIRGIDALSKVSVKELVGGDYENLLSRIEEAISYRNKIFHGQLTGDSLDRDTLLLYAESMKRWCQLLSEATEEEMGYDGFARNSFRKTNTKDFSNKLQIQINSIADYKDFVRNKMQR